MSTTWSKTRGIDPDNPEHMEMLADAIPYCTLCGGEAVHYGQFVPDPDKRQLYAMANTKPEQVGSIWYGLCKECGLLIHVAEKVERQIREDAARSRGD